MVVIESFGSALKGKNIAIEVSLEGTSPIISADGDGVSSLNLEAD